MTNFIDQALHTKLTLDEDRKEVGTRDAQREKSRAIKVVVEQMHIGMLQREEVKTMTTSITCQNDKVMTKEMSKMTM